MNEVNDNKDTMSRREREKAAHRKEILEAATRVFASKGFHSATLDEIAEEAEFSKGALYLYFQNKEDLLFSIMYESFERWYKIYSEIMSSDAPYPEKLLQFLKGAAETSFKDPDLSMLIGQQRATLFMTLSEENQNKMMKLHGGIWTNFTDVTQQAITDGELRDVCVEAIVGMVHGSIDSMIVSKWNCPSLKELNKAIDCFMDILMNGILNKEST